MQLWAKFTQVFWPVRANILTEGRDSTQGKKVNNTASEAAILSEPFQTRKRSYWHAVCLPPPSPLRRPWGPGRVDQSLWDSLPSESQRVRMIIELSEDSVLNTWRELTCDAELRGWLEGEGERVKDWERERLSARRRRRELPFPSELHPSQPHTSGFVGFLS